MTIPVLKHFLSKDVTVLIGGNVYEIEGICDWCKKPSFLTRHNYIDGKYHHSCEKCNDLARLDVRQFNLAEQQLIDRREE